MPITSKNSAFLIVVLFTVTINSRAVFCTPPDVAEMPPLSPPSPLLLNVSVHQLSNIIDALIGSTDFTNWTSIFSTIDPSVFPISATLFVPDDSALFSSLLPNVDPLVFAYHIVPQRLAFSELCLFDSGSHLPTLLLDKYILITSNSKANFTIDDSRVKRPDLFSTDSIVIHGIASILDYKVYGDISNSKPEDQDSKTESTVQTTKNTTDTVNMTGSTSPLLLPPRGEMNGQEQLSGEVCSCGKIQAFLLLGLLCLNRVGVLGFKI
ncbi:hypothetical protein MLD38_039248 [Melastoma candidum]|uniref:Uncharacterized protein n=1 Tax=Melastoma candidum TaxID=119954 RepID=A0ACB9L3V0_9MYRT|nr:hypothetical protein MLD38_039248 [Melastoma candidum]